MLFRVSLKERVVFAVSSAVRNNLFEICSPVDVQLILKELKHQESDT